MSSPTSNLPEPFIPASQWTQGEAMDEIKLHTRFDEPMDELASFYQGWGTQFAKFFAKYAGPAAVTAGMTLSWTPILNDGSMAGGSVSYFPPWPGVYLIGAIMRNLTTASFNRIQINSTPGGGGTRSWASPVRSSGVNNSTGLSVPIRTGTLEHIEVVAVQAMTADLSTASYLAGAFWVQQIGW